MKMKIKVIAECPSCGEMVLFGKNPKLGELITCRECEEELEVISLEPILLDFPLEDGEYDEEFDYDDDYDDNDSDKRW